MAQTQVWPVLRNLDRIVPSTAASISASSKMIIGALPPNSRLTFFTVPAALAMICLPIGVEPVKPILRTIGFVASSSPMADALLPTTMLNTPAGMPARSARTARARAE